MKTEQESGYFIPTKTAAIDMACIAILFCVSLIITNPVGDFPLNDDWSFGLAVKHLLEHGEFRPTGWTAMSLITQVLWGSLFSLPAGFSFTALRLSTLTLSLLGVLATYLLIRELRQPRWLACLASLTLAFTPIYFALSHTFMTDVPYTAIMVMASLVFVRNLNTGSDQTLYLGTSLALAATLTRQLAICVPLAFAVSSILKTGFGKREILRASLPAIVCIGALIAFQLWLAATGRLPACYAAQNDKLFHSLSNPKAILIVAANAFPALLYVGLFLMPVLIVFLGGNTASLWPNTKVLLIFSTSGMGIGALVTFLKWGKGHLLLPCQGNVLVRSGIGPAYLHDTEILQLNHIASLPASFWRVVSIIGLIGAILLLTALGLTVINLARKLRSARLDSKEAASVFLLLSAVIYLLPLLMVGYFDRYLVPTIPFLAGGIASACMHNLRTTRSNWICGSLAPVLLLVFGGYSICGTRDYLAWHRIRWEALNDLMKKGVKPGEIDGGVEFNGLYLYDPHYERDPKKSWWWVAGDTYRIGFGDMPEYKVINEYRYNHWMPPQARRIVVLKRNPPGTPGRRGDAEVEHVRNPHGL